MLNSYIFQHQERWRALPKEWLVTTKPIPLIGHPFEEREIQIRITNMTEIIYLVSIHLLPERWFGFIYKTGREH